MKLSLEGLNKAQVLVALYNASKPQGLGRLHYNPMPMTEDQAAELLAQTTYFDYIAGRVMKTNLSGNVLDTWGYDRDNGDGAAKRALEAAGIPVAVATEDGGHRTAVN